MHGLHGNTRQTCLLLEVCMHVVSKYTIHVQYNLLLVQKAQYYDCTAVFRISNSNLGLYSDCISCRVSLNDC